MCVYVCVLVVAEVLALPLIQLLVHLGIQVLPLMHAPIHLGIRSQHEGRSVIWFRSVVVV